MEYKENETFVAKMGDSSTVGYYTNGKLYYKLSPIARYFGYTDGISNAYYPKIGLDNIIRVEMGKQNIVFVNQTGVENILKFTTMNIPYDRISAVYKDLFNIERAPDGADFTYKFTDNQMLEIIFEINTVLKPTMTSGLIKKLKKGKIL